MRRYRAPSRRRRRLKWVGLVACCLILVLFGVSLVLYVGYDRDRICFRLWPGCAMLRFWGDESWRPSSVGWSADTYMPYVWRYTVDNYAYWPHVFRDPPPFAGARVPLWVPFLLAAIPTVWLWRRDRRPPKGGCQACGYNLTGNTSGVCPECGGPAWAHDLSEQVSPPDQRRPPTRSGPDGLGKALRGGRQGCPALLRRGADLVSLDARTYGQETWVLVASSDRIALWRMAP